MAKVAVVERRKSGGDGGSEGRERKREELGLGVGGSREGRTRGEKTEGGAEKGTVRGCGGNSRGKGAGEGGVAGRRLVVTVTFEVLRELRSHDVSPASGCAENRGGDVDVHSRKNVRGVLNYFTVDTITRDEPPPRGRYYIGVNTTTTSLLRAEKNVLVRSATWQFLVCTGSSAHGPGRVGKP